MRGRATAALLVIVVASSVGALAATQPVAAGGLVRQVGTEAELRAALVEADADDTGAHRIELTADIDIGETPLTYTGPQPLTVRGGGHTLRGEGESILHTLGPARLTIAGLTLTGAASGINAHGSVVIRNSTFRQLGVGHPLAQAHGAVSAGLVTPDSALLVVDSRFVGNRAFTSPLLSARRLEVVRSRFTGNVTTQDLIRGGPVVVRGSEILGTTTPSQRVIVAAWASLTLDHSLLAGTVVGQQAGPTIQAERGQVVLTGSIIRDNGSRGSHQYGVAVRGVRLRSDHSVIRHPERACWITDRSVWIASLASDPSCRFP